MIHRKSAMTPIADDEEILCRFERMVDGKFETYLAVGPFTYSEMKMALKGLITMADAHDKENSTDDL